MNKFAFGNAVPYLHTSSRKTETFKNQDNETSITPSSPTPQNGSKRLLPRIGLVSIPYQSRIILRSSFVASFFVVLSFSLPEAETIRKEYGNDTETIEEAREKQGRMLPTQNIFKFLKLYNYGKTQWYLNQTPGFSR